MKPRDKGRIPLNTSVTFCRGSLRGQGRVLDLTASGCLIESPVTVSKGDYLQLKMFLPGLNSSLAVDLAAVRWIKGRRFGVEFIKMTDSERRLLDRFMNQYVSSTRGGRDKFSDTGDQNWHLDTYSVAQGR